VWHCSHDPTFSRFSETPCIPAPEERLLCVYIGVLALFFDPQCILTCVVSLREWSVVTSTCHSSPSSKTAGTPSTGSTTRCPNAIHSCLLMLLWLRRKSKYSRMEWNKHVNSSMNHKQVPVVDCSVKSATYMVDQEQRTLQSRKWQLIGKSQWCCSAMWLSIARTNGHWTRSSS